MSTMPAEMPGFEPDRRRCIRVPLDRLVIDARIQRELTNVDSIEAMSHAFDWARFEVPTTVPLAGDFYRVIEGQRRCTALRMLVERLGLNPSLVLVWIIVLPKEYVGTETEADTGLAISTGRKAHDQHHQWRMRVTRGDEHELQAELVLDAMGLRLGRTPTHQTLACVAAVATLIHRGRQSPDAGAELLADTLSVIVAAWPHADTFAVHARFDGRLVEVLGRILYHNPELSRQRLVDVLATRSAARWIDEALTRRTPVKDNLGFLIVNAYNKRLRGGAQIRWQTKKRDLVGQAIEEALNGGSDDDDD